MLCLGNKKINKLFYSQKNIPIRVSTHSERSSDTCNTANTAQYILKHAIDTHAKWLGIFVQYIPYIQWYKCIEIHISTLRYINVLTDMYNTNNMYNMYKIFPVHSIHMYTDKYTNVYDTD